MQRAYVHVGLPVGSLARSSTPWSRQIQGHKHGYSHPARCPLGRRPPRHEIVERLISTHTDSSRSEEREHSHDAGFHHGRVRNMRMCLCVLRGPRAEPSLICRPFGTWEPDRQLERAFVREFGRRHPRTNDGIRGVQCCTCRKGECLGHTYL